MHEAWARIDGHAGVGQWPLAIEELEAARTRIVAAGAWTAGPATLIDVLGLTRNEVSQCRVLRWLLDPLARHGLGARLVAELADEFAIPVTAPEHARVTVEVARDDTRADIVIEGVDDGRCVVIEAKIDAGEGDRQGHRIEHQWPDASHLLYLTIRGDRIPRTAVDHDRWQPVSWGWFAGRVRQSLEGSVEPTDLRASDARSAAADWVATVERHLM